jgi:hypothetical protein
LIADTVTVEDLAACILNSTGSLPAASETLASAIFLLNWLLSSIFFPSKYTLTTLPSIANDLISIVSSESFGLEIFKIKSSLLVVAETTG